MKRENDNALRLALRQRAERQQLQQPSNFAYLTMQRIKAEQRRRERRNALVSIMFVSLVALFGLATLGYFYGPTLLASLQYASLPQSSLSLQLVLPTLFCLTFFAVINEVLKRHYRAK